MMLTRTAAKHSWTQRQLQADMAMVVLGVEGSKKTSKLKVFEENQK